jgi:hypothetical protein
VLAEDADKLLGGDVLDWRRERDGKGEERRKKSQNER